MYIYLFATYVTSLQLKQPIEKIFFSINNYKNSSVLGRQSN